MSIDAMKQALAYIEEVDYGPYDARPVITALRAAIEQAQQELVCVCGAIWEGQELVSGPPQRREWVGLTDEERTQLKQLGLVGVEIIEAKLKEKNT